MPRGKKKSTTTKRTKKTNKTANTSANVDNMKYEIASEFGVKLGANASSRDNGLVGGEMTKRLVQKATNRKQSNKKKSK